MSLSGDKEVAQFKKSVKMGHPNVAISLEFHPMQRFLLRGNPSNRYSVRCTVDGWISLCWRLPWGGAVVE